MIHQFEMYYANEYLEEIVADFAAVLDLAYDEKDVEAASAERDRCSLKNIFILKREGCILCIDCNDRDFIMPLVVMCQDSDADKIKPLMLAWDNKMREEYDQKLTKEIVDVYHVKDGSTLLSEIETFYHISIYDKFINIKEKAPGPLNLLRDLETGTAEGMQE